MYDMLRNAADDDSADSLLVGVMSIARKKCLMTGGGKYGDTEKEK